MWGDRLAMASESNAEVTSGNLPLSPPGQGRNHIWGDLAIASESNAKATPANPPHSPRGGVRNNIGGLAIASESNAQVTSGRVPLSSPGKGRPPPIWFHLAMASESNAEVTSGRVPLSSPGKGRPPPIWNHLALASESNAEVTSGNLPPSPSGEGQNSIRGSLAIASQSGKPVHGSIGPDVFLSDHIDPEVFVNQTVPQGLEVLQGKVIWFNSTENFQLFWASQQKPGRFNHVANWDLLHRDLQILAVDEIVKESVLMLCHRTKPELCHLPLHGQTFYSTAVRFVDNGQLANMFFTQHMMNPNCDPNCYPSCDSDCGYMYHALDYVLFRHKGVFV